MKKGTQYLKRKRLVEDPQEQDQEATPPIEAASSAVKLAWLKAVWARASMGFVRLARCLGLFLFMTILPLLLVAYPAYRIVPRLLDYASAISIEATLQRFDIHTVERDQDEVSWFESRKHIDVVFYFKDAQGTEYAAVIERPWPSPGLRRKLSDEYAAGDEYSLLRLPDQRVLMEEQVAKEGFMYLTILMALVFLASLPFFLLWKRLAQRQPDSMPAFPVAGAKSFMVGQLVALVLAGMLTFMMAYAPAVRVPPAFYLAGYWGLALFLAIALRLLVFDAPTPMPPEVIKENGASGR